MTEIESPPAPSAGPNVAASSAAQTVEPRFQLGSPRLILQAVTIVAATLIVGGLVFFLVRTLAGSNSGSAQSGVLTENSEDELTIDDSFGGDGSSVSTGSGSNRDPSEDGQPSLILQSEALDGLTGTSDRDDEATSPQSPRSTLAVPANSFGDPASPSSLVVTTSTTSTTSVPSTTSSANTSSSTTSTAVSTTVSSTVPSTSSPASTTAPTTVVPSTSTTQPPTTAVPTTQPSTTRPATTTTRPTTTTGPTVTVRPLPLEIITPADGSFQSWNTVTKIQVKPVAGAIRYCFTVATEETKRACGSSATYNLPARAIDPGPATIGVEAFGRNEQLLTGNKISVRLLASDVLDAPSDGDSFGPTDRIRLRSKAIPGADEYCWLIRNSDATSGQLCRAVRRLDVGSNSEVREELGSGNFQVLGRAYRDGILIGQEQVAVTLR